MLMIMLMIILMIMLMMMTCIGLIVIDAVDVYDVTFARDGSPGQIARDVICYSRRKYKILLKFIETVDNDVLGIAQVI